MICLAVNQMNNQRSCFILQTIHTRLGLTFVWEIIRSSGESHVTGYINSNSKSVLDTEIKFYFKITKSV